jgi:putative ABC transport system permease protein
VVEEIQDVIDRITRFVTGIAVIALVVGAIGIANITLVSVTERTKEIGIMKAVGATNRDTMQLFLTEAVLLGGIGAIVGVPLGLLVGFGAAVYAEVSFTLPIDWIVFSVVMGVTTGVVAGLYPAWRASKVDPIEALRYE